MHPVVLDWWRDRLRGADVFALEGADLDFHTLDSVFVADTIGAFITGERRESVEERVGRHGGSVVKHMGDGTLATFPTGSRADDAAASIRSALAGPGLDACFGVAVHLAARVMSEAATGQILATSTAVESVVGGPRRFETLGLRLMKGIDRPWELYSLSDEPSN